MMLGSKKVAILSFLAHRSCEGVWEVCFPVNERIGGRARRLLYSLLAPGVQITARSCPPVRSASHLYILPSLPPVHSSLGFPASSAVSSVWLIYADHPGLVTICAAEGQQPA